jgi:predicted NAD/FAD-dependent oxidoreductase
MVDNDLPKVAVIGAGISGLVCARLLVEQGMEVTVIEKSRGVGGRMADLLVANA